MIATDPNKYGIELTIIDASDITGKVAAALRLDELYMYDVSSMVARVLDRCASRGGVKVSRLNVMDHGNADGIQLGRDWVTVTTLSRFAPTLRLLRGSFTPKGFVHFQHCNAGQNKALLIKLASILDTTVYAGMGLHNPVYRVNTGTYERCSPSGTCESDVGRP